jgi:hypothetical protein
VRSHLETNHENGNWIHPRAALITGIVFAAAALRIVPHPMNFAPIGAVALFGGANFSSKRAAMIVPLLSLVAGDIFTGFHRLVPYVYASFLISVAIGFWLRPRKSASRIAAGTVAGAFQFFVITNFAVWAASIGNYPKNLGGLAACYIAGAPLFWNTLAGDAFYVALLFGGMALAEKRFRFYFNLSATLAMPASAQASSLSPPGAPLTPIAPMTSVPALIGTPPCIRTVPATFGGGVMAPNNFAVSPDVLRKNSAV